MIDSLLRADLLGHICDQRFVILLRLEKKLSTPKMNDNPPFGAAAFVALACNTILREYVIHRSAPPNNPYMQRDDNQNQIVAIYNVINFQATVDNSTVLNSHSRITVRSFSGRHKYISCLILVWMQNVCLFYRRRWQRHGATNNHFRTRNLCASMPMEIHHTSFT